MYFPKPSLNENDLAIIERGDTAAHAIEAGQYVSWKGKLGKAISSILQGATLDDSLFDYETDGVINSLSNNFEEGTFTPSFPRNTATINYAKWVRIYNFAILEMIVTISSSSGGNSYIDPSTLPKFTGYVNPSWHGTWHNYNGDNGGEIGSSTNNNMSAGSAFFSKGGSHFALPADKYALTMTTILFPDNS